MGSTARSDGESPIEAVEWIQRAEGGGTQSQVFRLEDGRHAVVKFPENPQGGVQGGGRVLVNEFIACRVAEILELPVNRAVLVLVADSLLARPKSTGECPAFFSGGVCCGLIRFAQASQTDPSTDLFRQCVNADEIHGVLLLEELVKRGDGRQLLVYPSPADGRRQDGPARRFAAYDYGFSFGGSPNWTQASLSTVSAAQLPASDAIGAPYTSGDHQGPTIDRLRRLRRSDCEAIIAAVAPPRWGLTAEEGVAIVDFLEERARELVRQYDEKYRPQMEAFP